jgi:tRNA pseudouridine55 synthase
MISQVEISRNHVIPTKADIIENGHIFLVIKPMGWTSFDVVKKIRIHFGVKKVGHAGTLDPLASGLLIVGTGKKTKEISQYSELKKEYEGVMVLGARTASYDTETEITDLKDYSHIKISDIENMFKTYIGDQLQKPPMYSAIKHQGRRLYKYAREGQEIISKDREVNIEELNILTSNLPEVSFKVTCSKGTYIRSLVNDIGEKLGCGAYLKSLTRTRIGQFSVREAFTIEELTLPKN